MQPSGCIAVLLQLWLPTVGCAVDATMYLGHGDASTQRTIVQLENVQNNICARVC